MTNPLTNHLDQASRHMDRAKEIIEPIYYEMLQTKVRKVYYFRTDQLINDARGELECRLYAGREKGAYGIYLASGHILEQNYDEAKDLGYQRVGRTHLMIKFK